MNRTLEATPLRRLAALDLDWCLRFYRISQRRELKHLFAVVSRLGDGVFWYSLMLALLLILGDAAWPVVVRMLVTGGLALVLYKWLKSRITRLRPCARHDDRIHASVAPLDEYSFPSGHTLHAVSFSIVAICAYPILAWLVIPFTTLVALSRVVLGLHYPSDVLAGVLLGGALATLVLQF